MARGDLLVGNATPAWDRLAFPASPTGKVVVASATDIGWSANPLGSAAWAATGDFAPAAGTFTNTITQSPATDGIDGIILNGRDSVSGNLYNVFRLIAYANSGGATPTWTLGIINTANSAWQPVLTAATSGAATFAAGLTIAGALAGVTTTQFHAITYTWPSADAGASGYVLSSNASGTLSWVAQTAAAAVTSVAGRTGAVVLTAADIGAGTFPSGQFKMGGTPWAASLDALNMGVNQRITFRNYNDNDDVSISGGFNGISGSALTVTGYGLEVLNRFGCNGKSAQPAYASGGAAGGTLAQVTTLANNIRAALVADGIMS